MDALGGPWDRRDAAPTPDDLPQLDGSCDVCEPDEAQPATEVCHACSFAFCPGHADEHSRRTRHRLTPYRHETPERAGLDVAAAVAAPVRRAQEVGIGGLVLNDEEEVEGDDADGDAAEGGAPRAGNDNRAAEILGMLAAAAGAGREEQAPADGGGVSASGGDPRADEASVPSGGGGGGAEAAAPEARARDTVSVERLRCRLHDQEGTLYCRTDEKIVCVLCAVQGEHCGHEIITLHEAYTWQKNREGPDLLGQTKLMGRRIMSKWSDPVMTTEELQAYMDTQFDELKNLVRLEERRTLHLVDLKEAFLTATAAEKIAEITMETERLQEEMTSISYELGVLNRAKMEAAPSAAAQRILEAGPRQLPVGLGLPGGQPHHVEARPRLPEPRAEPRRNPIARRDPDEDGPGPSMGHAP